MTLYPFEKSLNRNLTSWYIWHFNLFTTEVCTLKTCFNIYSTNSIGHPGDHACLNFFSICLYLSEFVCIFVYMSLSTFFQHLSNQQHVGSQRIMPVWIPSNLVKFTFPASSGARRLFPNVTQAIILMKILASSQFEKLCS